MQISIFGLGYVGVVSAACLARDGHNVIGMDIDPKKLQMLREGKSPIVEEGILELVRNVTQDGRFRVTDSVQEAIANSELSFVCVGTPSKPNGSQDQTAIMRTAVMLGESLAEKNEFHTIVFRSTVLPGTVQNTLVPILEESSGKRNGADFAVCFQPEFLREGTSIRDYDHPPYTIVGCNDESAIEPIRSLYGHLKCDFIVTSIACAETVKYFCNIFHALKITFANEVGRSCQAIGVDSHEVMELLCRDRQLNISPAYLKPGFAFGGSCLPKDLRAILHIGKHQEVQLPLLEAIQQSNQIHLNRALEYILASGKRKIGMLGLSFKSGTDDLRESPYVTLAEMMIGKGLDLKIYDPNVLLSSLMGANKSFIERTIPHVGSLLTDDIDGLLAESELIIVAQNQPETSAVLARRLNSNQVVLDLVRLPNADKIQAEYRGICW